MNETLLVIGYGSLLSGHGLLTVRRNGKSRLIARQAFPVRLRNARRGLAKPTSHGQYLAMDLEPIERSQPISGYQGFGRQDGGELGALALLFERRWAADLARREEYDPDKFLQLLEISDRAQQPLGEFLLDIARRTRFDLLEYRRTLAQLLGYTSPGYIFHPLPLDDGRVALVAIASGFEGSGDPAIASRRRQAGIDRLLTLPEALAVTSIKVDPVGQMGYFLECVLGGAHGLWVSDLLAGLEGARGPRSALANLMAEALAAERAHFLQATALDETAYRAVFGNLAHSGLDRLLDSAAA
jgi:hypothetical protein